MLHYALTQDFPFWILIAASSWQSGWNVLPSTYFAIMGSQPFDNVPDSRRRMMAAIKGKHTLPERLLRSALHRAGYRFRLHCRDLPGRPDLAFPSRRKAVEVRGCFWHQHPGCPKCSVPSTRREYWLPKLARNRERDLINERALTALGWRILVIWECELRDLPGVLRRARRFLGKPGKQNVRICD